MRILLAVVAVIGVTTVIVTIVIGARVFDGTVVRDPYASGLRWDARQRARAESGWRVSLPKRTYATGMNDIVVDVSDRNGTALRDAAVVLQVGYPSTGRFDSEHVLHADGRGRYHGTVDLPRKGQWYLQFFISKNGTEAAFDESIYAE